MQPIFKKLIYISFKSKLFIDLLYFFSSYSQCYITSCIEFEDYDMNLNLPQTHDTHVETVAQKIDKIPHVTQIASHANGKYLLNLLPHESNHIEHNEHFQFTWRLSTLTLLLVLQFSLHSVCAKQSHKIIIRTL